jgi:hypothetical protein
MRSWGFVLFLRSSVLFLDHHRGVRSRRIFLVLDRLSVSTQLDLVCSARFSSWRSRTYGPRTNSTAVLRSDRNNGLPAPSPRGVKIKKSQKLCFFLVGLAGVGLVAWRHHRGEVTFTVFTVRTTYRVALYFQRHRTSNIIHLNATKPRLFESRLLLYR